MKSVNERKLRDAKYKLKEVKTILGEIIDSEFPTPASVDTREGQTEFVIMSDMRHEINDFLNTMEVLLDEMKIQKMKKVMKKNSVNLQ